MSSQRRKLQSNVNDSKNTRMTIVGPQASWKPEELGHISRYCKIADIIVQRSRQLGRPLHCLEAGCGEVWVLRHIYKSLVLPKAALIASYLGVDIDPAVLQQPLGWPQDVSTNEAPMMRLMNAHIEIQDLTTNPRFNLDDSSVDVFWSTEVIEHMKPEFVEPWLADAWRCLQPEGIAYISTPNHDGSAAELPEDHVYEWGHGELKALLSKFFHIELVHGVFIQQPKFKQAQAQQARWPANVIQDIQQRFSPEWQRVILATAYPEYSNNAAFILRKKV